MTEEQKKQEEAARKAATKYQECGNSLDWPQFLDAFLLGIEWDRSAEGDGLSPHVKFAAYHAYKRAVEKYGQPPPVQEPNDG